MAPITSYSKSMRILFVPVLILLNACATFSPAARQEAVKERMATWKGKTSQELIEKWGIPARMMDMPDGGKAYEYVFKGNSYSTVQVESRTEATIYDVNNDCLVTQFLDKSLVITRVTWRGNCR